MIASCLFPDLQKNSLSASKDIVFLSNPFPHFFGDSDIEAMTDHFFPAKHLWATWLRPAEHINTGFLLAKPSVKLFVPWPEKNQKKKMEHPKNAFTRNTGTRHKMFYQPKTVSLDVFFSVLAASCF